MTVVTSVRQRPFLRGVASLETKRGRSLSERRGYASKLTMVSVLVVTGVGELGDLHVLLGSLEKSRFVGLRVLESDGIRSQNGDQAF